MRKAKVAHNSKEFFIDNQMILIRPLNSEEQHAQHTYQTLKGDKDYTTIGEFESSPDRKLFYYCADQTDNCMVYIAHSEESDEPEPLGFAVYAKNKITKSHEMAVFVKSYYAKTRLPFELMQSLISDASDHNVWSVYTIDDTYDSSMRAIAEKMNMSVRLVQGQNRRVRYTLQVDKHPGVPKLTL